MIKTWFLLGPLLTFAAAVAGLSALYWTIRLAVRHGIEDARRRRERAQADDAGWDTARF